MRVHGSQSAVATSGGERVKHQQQLQQNYPCKVILSSVAVQQPKCYLTMPNLVLLPLKVHNFFAIWLDYNNEVVAPVYTQYDSQKRVSTRNLTRKEWTGIYLYSSWSKDRLFSFQTSAKGEELLRKVKVCFDNFSWISERRFKLNIFFFPRLDKPDFKRAWLFNHTNSIVALLPIGDLQRQFLGRQCCKAVLLRKSSLRIVASTPPNCIFFFCIYYLIVII